MAGLAQRLAHIEGARGSSPATTYEPAVGAAAGPSRSPGEVAPAALREVPAGFDLPAGLALVGRTLIVLGGAFLLRAATDAALLPPRAGVACGLAYALVWLAAADRSARLGRTIGAGFHAAAFALIAFPIAWEATLRFTVWPPALGALATTVVALLALGFATRHGLAAPAWLGLLLGALGAWLLAVATRSWAPNLAAGLIVGCAALWAADRYGWGGLRALSVLLAIGLFASSLAVSPPFGTLLSPRAELALTALFLMTLPATLVARGHLGATRPRVGLLEEVGTAASLVVGLAALVLAARAAPGDRSFAAAAAIALGLAAYALAVRPATRRGAPTQRARRLTAASGLALLLAGTALWLPAAAAALLWATLGVAATWAAGRTSLGFLAWQGAALLVAAGTRSGLIAAAGRALGGATPGTAAVFDLTDSTILAAALVCVGLAWNRPQTNTGRVGAPALVLALFVWGVLGLLVGLLARVVQAPGGEIDRGALAALRTVLVAVTVILLAITGRRERGRAARFLVAPLLLLGAVKLLVEDLFQGRPATLFVGLAAYGGALLVAARSARRRAAVNPGG